MRKYFWGVLLGTLMWIVLFLGLRSAFAQDPACALPAVEFLGEGPGAYTAPAGYNQLIVKKFSPFRFEVLAGTSYTSTRRAAPPERVWACEGNCALPAVYHDVVDFGYQDQGARFDVVVIDDDTDNRLNYWAVDDPAVPVAWLSAQGLVQSATYTTPVAGNWYLYAADSIGLVQPCVNPPEPTPPDAPQPPVETPTASATATLVESSTLTPTATPSPVETATEAATPTPGETIVDDPFTATPTNTPGAVLTLTATPSATATTAEQPTASPTPQGITPPPTATQAPTGLGDGPEPTAMLKVFLPVIDR